jgi:hypothetical protein
LGIEAQSEPGNRASDSYESRGAFWQEGFWEWRGIIFDAITLKLLEMAKECAPRRGTVTRWHWPCILRRASGSSENKLRWIMNFTKNIKWQLVLAALGVSLFMTSAIRAQEIENTDFATPATSVSGNFNTPSAAAASTAANNEQVQDAAISEASILPASQTNVGSFPRTLGSLIAIGVLLIACGLLWKGTRNRGNDTLKNHNALSMRKNSLPNRKAQALHS